MSFTITRCAETDPYKTSIILVQSPSKRRRLSPPDLAVRTPTISEIWSWTLTSAAIAQCSIRDVHEMKENTVDSHDFFWLGRIPCRTVNVVGIVVGVQVYEKRILYTVDDGTSVIDCAQSHRLQPKSPTKPKSAISGYEQLKRLEPPLLPIPIAGVGRFVRLVGKIRSVHDSRQIVVDTIECSCPNDELIHARAVRQLHRTSYSLQEPFLIPRQIYQPAVNTPVKNKAPETPATARPSPSPISSVSSSPIKSPVKPQEAHHSPRRLRHPSRLHSQDLTDNTFRIYVKHYMDNAPIITESPEAEYDSDTVIGRSLADVPVTPTKRSRTNCDITPKPESLQLTELTPRPRMPPPKFGGNHSSSSSIPLQPPSNIPLQSSPARQGFTLSYLRRVPELSLLASRVVEAVARRRLRAERKKLQEAGISQQGTRKSKNTNAAASSSTVPKDKLGPKMKRLFQWAVIQLLREGCVVLWDGPMRACPDASLANASRLWKTNTTFDNTLFSTSAATFSSSLSLPQYDEDDDAVLLSDPSPNEESYISLTPAYLAEQVEKTMQVLTDHYVEIRKPYAKITKEAITSSLRKDDRWRYVGDWKVDDALHLLESEGKVLSIGQGRWELTL
ncbi:hypothetical protein B0H34DRAFT_798891 [Crassisporium funariophilum]|nr:hypothetical protein B0H34DRAFT_798891 [Crassisporium funariophilum]